MSAFDRIIGYQTIKEELLQICDMIHNREIYENLGAKLPQGILLYGDPGLGKSLMAKSFITESGLPAYIVRRDKGSDDFIGKITDTFEKAKKNAPAIVLLDDMDKFANEDDRHIDAEEYVAVQAGIDEVKGCNVFVFATVNEIRKLPRSLIRSGRFDRKIEVNSPTDRDAEEIIKYYLAEKKVSDNVNMDDLVKMVSYGSCAELETILNEAAIGAAYARKEKIEMDDLVKSVLRMQYDAPDNFTKKSSDALKEIALHEAGRPCGLRNFNSRQRWTGFPQNCRQRLNRRIYSPLYARNKAGAPYSHFACGESGGRALLFGCLCKRLSKRYQKSRK